MRHRSKRWSAGHLHAPAATPMESAGRVRDKLHNRRDKLHKLEIVKFVPDSPGDSMGVAAEACR